MQHITNPQPARRTIDKAALFGVPVRVKPAAAPVTCATCNDEGRYPRHEPCDIKGCHCDGHVRVEFCRCAAGEDALEREVYGDLAAAGAPSDGDDLPPY